MKTLHACSCCGFLSTCGTQFKKIGKKLLCTICAKEKN
jgi:hypothetical protein